MYYNIIKYIIIHSNETIVITMIIHNQHLIIVMFIVLRELINKHCKKYISYSKY